MIVEYRRGVRVTVRADEQLRVSRGFADILRKKHMEFNTSIAQKHFGKPISFVKFTEILSNSGNSFDVMDTNIVSERRRSQYIPI
jgi:hypothetical protein